MIRCDPAFEAWVETGRAISVDAAATRIGFQPVAREARAREKHGACPVCHGRDRFFVNPTRSYWGCRKCGKGGRDGIGLVMFALDLDFLAACEDIAGPRPEPPAGESAAERVERQARIEARLAEIRAANHAATTAAEGEDNAWREKERRKAVRWWNRGSAIAGTPVEAYLAARGVDLPARVPLRFHPDWPLYGDRDGLPAAGADDDRTMVVIHRGPVMMAPLCETVDGVERVRGLHLTWIDPDRPGAKIVVVDGRGERATAKKMRGLKKGCHIPLVSGGAAPRRLFLGEGIETVLTVWTALRREGSRLLDGAAFWAAGDLGNLAGGRALDRLAHPSETATDRAGRQRVVKVPGIVFDPASICVVIPDSVVDLHLVGDGDSEPFRTRCVMARAAARHARPGRTVRVTMAPTGRDFNDLVQHGR